MPVKKKPATPAPSTPKSHPLLPKKSKSNTQATPASLHAPATSSCKRKTSQASIEKEEPAPLPVNTVSEDKLPEGLALDFARRATELRDRLNSIGMKQHIAAHNAHIDSMAQFHIDEVIDWTKTQKALTQDQKDFIQNRSLVDPKKAMKNVPNMAKHLGVAEDVVKKYVESIMADVTYSDKSSKISVGDLELDRVSNLSTVTTVTTVDGKEGTTTTIDKTDPTKTTIVTTVWNVAQDDKF